MSNYQYNTQEHDDYINNILDEGINNLLSYTPNYINNNKLLSNDNFKNNGNYYSYYQPSYIMNSDNHSFLSKTFNNNSTKLLPTNINELPSYMGGYQHKKIKNRKPSTKKYTSISQMKSNIIELQSAMYNNNYNNGLKENSKESKTNINNSFDKLKIKQRPSSRRKIIKQKSNTINGNNLSCKINKQKSLINCKIKYKNMDLPMYNNSNNHLQQEHTKINTNKSKKVKPKIYLNNNNNTISNKLEYILSINKQLLTSNKNLTKKNNLSETIIKNQQNKIKQLQKEIQHLKHPK